MLADIFSYVSMRFIDYSAHHGLRAWTILYSALLRLCYYTHVDRRYTLHGQASCQFCLPALWSHVRLAFSTSRFIYIIRTCPKLSLLSALQNNPAIMNLYANQSLHNLATINVTRQITNNIDLASEFATIRYKKYC